MINQERLVKEFMDMVKINSLSHQEGNFASYLKNKLIELGLEVYIDEQAGSKAGSNCGNLLGRLKGNRQDAPVVLLSAHMDTVPSGEGIQPQLRDDAIYSSGDTVLGSDDKAGVAAIIEALRHIQEEQQEYGDIEVLFTVGEEEGLLGARYLDYEILRAKMAFVLDSDGAPGTIIRQAAAHDKIHAVIHGKAAHAGMNPEDGISSIQVAARAINNMNLLRIDKETTANIGVIKGGEVTNIVCDWVELIGEARSMSEGKLRQQTKHMINCLQEACGEMGARLEVETEKVYPAFILQQDEPILEIARQAAESLGLELKVTSSGGGSDANYFSYHGIKTVNLGIGMSNVHTNDEYIKVKDLEMTARYVVAIIDTSANL